MGMGMGLDENHFPGPWPRGYWDLIWNGDRDGELELGDINQSREKKQAASTACHLMQRGIPLVQTFVRLKPSR